MPPTSLERLAPSPSRAPDIGPKKKKSTVYTLNQASWGLFSLEKGLTRMDVDMGKECLGKGGCSLSLSLLGWNWKLPQWLVYGLSPGLCSAVSGAICDIRGMLHLHQGLTI